MQKNKTKLSIITLMTTAIVCFIVAILGMGMAKNSVPTMADDTLNIDHVVTHTVTHTGTEGTNTELHIVSRLPHSADATKVYIEYTLGNDDAAGHSFLFGKSVGTFVGAFSQENVWQSIRWTQANSHIAAANNPQLYTASYKVIFDIANKTVTWYRGADIIYNGTSENKQGNDMNLADAIAFGMHTYTTAAGGSLTIKIYDDMGKDLGITTWIPKSTIVEYPKATFDANYEGGEDKVVDVTRATVAAPTDFVREGYDLIGWYTDAECTTAYDFNKEVVGDITLYAKWVAEPKTYYMISDSTQSDPWKWSTVEAPAENATKVTITFKVISRTGTGRHFQMLAIDGTTEKTSLLHGALKFSDEWFANGVTATFVADLTAKTYSLYNADGTKWDSTSLTYESANKFGAIIYKEYPAAVIGLYEITAVDDTGKDLGITSSSAGVTITTDKVYTVNMNANNGAAASKAFVKAGSTLAETTPLYDGYLFKGWFTDAECTTAYDFSQEVSSDLDLYAKWVAIDHVVAKTVTFTGVEGTNHEFHVASRLPHSADATKVYVEYTLTDIDGAGHSFLFGKSVGTLAGAFSERNVWKSVRWTQVNSHIAVANNAALYSGSYTIIFDFATNSMLWYRGTTLILTGNADNLQGTAMEFADAIGFGLHTYTTAGSGEMSIKIYDDMGKDLDITTYKATNNAIEYNKATYDVNYEGGEDKVVDVKKATISSKDITREGYTLEGWYTDAECTTPYDFTKEVAGDITIYAKWTEIPKVVVTFNANGGADVDPQTIYVDTKATAPTSTKTGYDLVGWYSDAELTQEFNFDTVVTEDITLYAKWTIQVYEVVFNTNGGNTIDNASVEYNQTLTLPAAPTKDGYVFVGWYTDEALEVEYDSTAVATAGFTLYAKWIEVFTVTFNTDGGTEIEAQEVNAGSKATEPTAPEKEGFTFDGWYAGAEATEAFDFNTAIDADITLYARWTAIPVDDKTDDAEPSIIDKLVSKVTNKLGCAGSLAQDSFMIIGSMLAVAGVIVIKALKKKED